MKLSLFIKTISFCIILTTACYADMPNVSCRVVSEKVCYKPGETAKFNIEVNNKTSSKLVGCLNISIVDRLDNIEHSEKIPLEVASNSKSQNQIEWEVPQGQKWGHEIRASFLDGSDTQLSSGIDFFATGKKAWQVGHWNIICNTGNIKDLNEINTRIIRNFRTKYNTAVDYFSWQPSGWETMAPEEDEWLSGQTTYLERKLVLKKIISEAHKNGIEMFSYYQGNSWGSAGVEFIRSHPEWWNYDRQGKPFPKICSYSVSVLDKMRKGETLKELPWCWFSSGVIWNEDMKKFMFAQLKQSVEMFGWDGFRSDGLPMPGNIYDSSGKYHNVLGDDPIKTKIEFINELRQWIKDNIGENVCLHFNSGTVEYGAERGDRKLFQAKAKGSYALWESALYASVPGTDLSNMKVFAKYLHTEVQAAREVRGYRHVGWMQVLPELLEATATACGAQVDVIYSWDGHVENSPAPSSRVFTFRFSRFFWDPDLRHVEEASKFLSVKAPGTVWWNDLLQVCKGDGNKTFYIQHLINLPKGYPRNRGKASVQKNIDIVFKNTDKSKVRAFLLSPDFGIKNMCNELNVKIKGNQVLVTVPELKVWNVVVFELVK